MANVIPESVSFTVDIRDIDQDSINKILSAVSKQVKIAENQFGVTSSYKLIGSSKVYNLSKDFAKLIEEKVKEFGEPYMIMHSGAVHDCAMFTDLMDVGMIFIPSHKGYSHNPLEYSSLEDISLGCQVLLDIAVELCK